MRRLARSITAARYSQPSAVATYSDIGDPRAIERPALESTIEHIPSHRRARITFGCDPVGASIHRTQALASQALSHPLMAHLQALRTQSSHDASTSVAALALCMQAGHLHIQGSIAQGSIAGATSSPLTVARARDLQQAAQTAHTKPVALSLDPGVPHRDTFAKYAAAFLGSPHRALHPPTRDAAVHSPLPIRTPDAESGSLLAPATNRPCCDESS
jgi:hypothetical protein